MTIEVHTADEALGNLMHALCVMDGREVSPNGEAFRDMAVVALADLSVLSLYMAQLAQGHRREPIDPDFAARVFEV